MSEHHDDDTPVWDDPEWDRTGELPLIRGDDTGSVERTASLGRLARGEPGARRRRAVTGATRRSGRRQPFERTRTHHVVTRSTPAVPPVADAVDGWAPVDHWVEPEPNRASGIGVDPRLLRVGALVGAAVLLVPVVASLGGDPGEERLAAGAVTTTVPPATLPDPTTTTITVPATDPGGTSPAPQAFAAPAQDEQPAAAASADAAASAQATSEPEQEVQACAGTYTVVHNDAWLRFPATSGASVEEWLAANDATLDTPLYVGDELCIPPGAKAPDPPATTAPPTTAAPITTAVPTTAAPTTAAPTTAVPTTAAPTNAPRPTTPPTTPPTTAAPATTAPPATIPSGAPSTEPLCGALPTSNGNPPGTPGPREVEALIREIWPDDLEVRALCIAKREANLRADLNNYCCYGVFAIYYKWVPDDLKQQFGLDEPADLFDARTNVALAYQLYLRGGWTPWKQTDPGPG
jgi:hypothetical protein